MVRLNRTHSLINLQAKFFSKIFQKFCLSVKFTTNHAKFAPFLNLSYIMFQAPALAGKAQEFQRITQIPRSSPT